MLVVFRKFVWISLLSLEILKQCNSAKAFVGFLYFKLYSPLVIKSYRLLGTTLLLNIGIIDLKFFVASLSNLCLELSDRNWLLEGQCSDQQYKKYWFSFHIRKFLLSFHWFDFSVNHFGTFCVPSTIKSTLQKYGSS